MKLTFREKQQLEGEVTEFIFDTPQDVIWRPGQFIHYVLPHDNPDDRGIERWFTISSAPYTGHVSITTRLYGDASSSFKKALNNLQPGDEIEADSPDGSFVIDDFSKDYVFIVGGIGFTPFHSILDQMEHDGKGANIEILYANRSPETTAYKTMLDNLASKHNDINVRYFYGDERITEDAIREAGAKLNNPIYYVSGPEPMTEAFEGTLNGLDIDDAHSKFDYFPGYESV